jgi:PD-(D/E)XK nuclease superfamily
MSPEEGLVGTEDAEDLAALERFVVDNEDLLALESLIGRFNIFDALAISQAEIRHSNFLAFILDPAESHGQGQLFLKALLMDLLKVAPATLRPFSPIDLDGIDLRGVNIRREWGHIDLLITCEEPPFVIVIENKVGSHEHSGQLGRYQETIENQYPQARPLYVYLTPSGDEPSEETWVPYSYADIHRVLTRVRTTYHNAIGEDTRIFLDHYLSLIGNRFMSDANIDELCQRIYKNHRRALDLIYERVGNPASTVLAEAETVLRKDARWHVFYRAGNLLDFVPTAWLKWLPPVGLDRKDDPRSWFVFRLELYGQRLDFYVEVRRMADLTKRRKIAEALIAKGPKFGFRHSGREIKDNYTRVSGRERILKWEQDEDEPEAEVIRTAIKTKLDDLFPKLEGVPSVLRPLLADKAT